MPNPVQVINAYNDLLYEIYKQEELVCLSDNQYIFNGKNVISYSNPAVVKSAKVGVYELTNKILGELNRKEFSDMLAIDELIVASADIKYRLGTLYLYVPHIVKLIDSHYLVEDRKQFYYDQTRNDSRFNRELPIVFEAIYKFWQRLGDYILYFFPKALKACDGRSFFLTPLDYIKKNHPSLCISANFKWLEDFSGLEYVEINRHRKYFVHHAGYNTTFFKKFLDSHSNEEDVYELDKERAEWPIKIKNYLNTCNEGFFKMLDFLNEIEFFLEEKNGIKLISYSLS